MKKLSILEVFSLIVGSIIGLGAFTLPDQKFLAEAGIISTSIAIILAAISIMMIQKAYHIMLEKDGKAGGEFSYVYKYLGKKHGLFVGFILSSCYLAMIPLNVTAINYVLKYFFDFFPFQYLYTIFDSQLYLSEIILALVLISIFALINIQGIKLSARIQNILSLSLVLIVIMLLLVASSKLDFNQFYLNHQNLFQFSWQDSLKIFAIGPFLFLGFDIVPQLTEEFGFSLKKAQFLVIIAIIVGAILYIMINVLASFSLANNENWLVIASAKQHLGGIGLILIFIALMSAVIGGINAFMIASSKLIVAMANQSLIKSRYKNFKWAIILVCSLSIIVFLMGNKLLLAMVEASSLLAAITYLYVSMISFHLTKGFFAFLSIIISLSFSLLLVLPFSVARISILSYLIIIIWLIIFYFLIKK